MGSATFCRAAAYGVMQSFVVKTSFRTAPVSLVSTLSAWPLPHAAPHDAGPLLSETGVENLYTRGMTHEAHISACSDQPTPNPQPARSNSIHTVKAALEMTCEWFSL